jgi:DNA gyrase subunit A
VVGQDIGEVRPININDEMRNSYLDYAMSVIVSRALPDVRDGLKPVQRRILYAMYDMGIRPTSSYKKSARITGEVLGKYHPHGDTAVYDAMVRMAQPFSLRAMLVDGQGNFGSVDGDPPAAMRYTEARLAPIAMTLLNDIDKETVDWIDNFDTSLKEPLVLPSILPNLLVNGAAGIAVGMATNIPPHNVGELCDAIVHLIRHPEASLDELMEFVKGPDFPTGAHIYGNEGIRNAYATGRGRIMMQASHEIEEVKRNNRQHLLFTEIPYQVNKSTLVAKIADLIKSKTLDGVSEVRDESDRKGMRVVLDLRRGASVSVILNVLYKHTALRTSFSANMLAIVDGMPKVFTLREALRYFIEFRREVVVRRAEFDLRKARARLHILEGLRTALDNLDAVIALIRGSSDVETARTGLMTEFNLSQIQAQAILDMQLRRLAALEREKIENEYNELVTLVTELEDLLSSPDKVYSVIRKETLDLKRRHGDERRTEVHPAELGEWRREDTEPHETVVITLSANGYLKRIPLATYRAQHRGGKGVKGQRMTKEDDVTPHLRVADTHDWLLMFTDRGRVFASRAFELPADASRTSRGTPVANVINLEPREHVNAVVTVSDLREDKFLVMATVAGQVKRMHLPEIANIRRGGLNAFNLKPGDELQSVILATYDEDIIMVSEQGMAIRFPSGDIRARQRAAGGMRGMTLQPNDKIVSADVVSPTGSLLVVTRRGYGKLSEMRRYRQQKRGGKGLITLKIARKNGRVAAAQVVDREVDGDDTVLILTEKAQVIRVHLNEIRETGRITQGVIMAVPDTGDAVSAIRAMKTREAPADLLSEEELAAAEAGEAPQNGVASDELVDEASEIEDSSSETPEDSETEDAPEDEEED